MEKVIALAWATKKRHIAIDGEVLCVPVKSRGYSVKNGCYNSLGLSGIPDTPKKADDIKYSHCDGLIKFAPLDQQETKIVTSSICVKCLKKYEKALLEAKPALSCIECDFQHTIEERVNIVDVEGWNVSCCPKCYCDSYTNA